MVLADVPPERKPERGVTFAKTTLLETALLSPSDPFLVLTEGWFPKGWFRRMFPRNENRNEGTFAKTTLLRKPPFYLPVKSEGPIPSSLRQTPRPKHLTNFQSFSLINWRQIWRVAGRESGNPELLGSPQTSPEVPPTCPEVFFGDFPGSSLTVELYSNPGVPRKFPKLPRKFPGLPRKFPGLPRRSALSLRISGQKAPLTS